MFTNAEAMALFNKATSLARKFEVFGDIPPATVLSAIDAALAAIADSDMSEATKQQLTAELNQYKASVNTSNGKPEVTQAQDPSLPTSDSTPTIPAETPTTISSSEIPNQTTTSETITSPNSITENVFDPSQEAQESVFDPRQEVQESVFDPTAGSATGSAQGLVGQTNQTRSTATAQDTANFQTKQDWRVRLSLAPSATYLYKAENPGILKPLKDTDGVIFPYLPTVNVNYTANYDSQELTHTNYKAYQYRSSSVEQVQISGDFTAQDANEANYMLAVIHFFRSVTKMFYGQDQNPKPGTPPPLVFLFGLGDFQFNAHPLVVTSFNYSLPNDVDYIRASAPTLPAGVSTAGYTTASNSTSPSNVRLNSSGLNTGATSAPPQFQTDSNSQPTYVPTKMQIQITALPITTRNDISNNFSLKAYATGALLRGTQSKRAGIW